MAARVPKPPHPPAVTHDGVPPDRQPHWELVQRVLASRQFERAPRLRALLEYISRRTIFESATEIRESEIATAVFDRPADFDATQDTIVRVQASHLRKRLAQYFQEEGAAEPVVLEIPKGNYVPLFRDRAAAPVETPVPAPAPANSYRVATWILVPVVVVLAALCAWLAVGRPRIPDAAIGPELRLLWSNLLIPGRATELVVADSCLAFFRDLLEKEPVALSAYMDHSYLRELEGLSPQRRTVAQALAKRQYTSLADVELASSISRLAAVYGSTLSPAYARYFTPRQFHGRHVILLGSRYSNPWSELFEQRLNFRVTRKEGIAVIQNQRPQPGEEALYSSAAATGESGESYGTLAFLPNLDHSGNVLIVSGCDMEATEAIAQFLFSEQLFAAFTARLPAAARSRLPYFEGLVRVRKVGGAARDIQLTAYRLYPR